jgi:ribosomal protein S18 acetylase RimI-like enzyme
LGLRYLSSFFGEGIVMMEIIFVKNVNEKHTIKYRIIQAGDFQQTVDLCSQIFTKYEPITKSLNINYQEFRQIAEPYCIKAIEDRLSIVATDSNGQIVGFTISEHLMSQPPYLKDISYKFEPIQALSYDLKYSYSRSQYYLKLFQTLHILMVGVKEEYKNQKIAKTLIKENLKLAKINNFSVAIAEATGLISQNIFRSLGFKEEVIFLYNSYIFRGEEKFSSIKESVGCALMSYSIF